MTIPIRTLAWAVLGGLLLAGVAVGLAVPFFPGIGPVGGVLITLFCVVAAVLTTARRGRPSL